MNTFDQIEELDPEFWCDYEGLEHQMSTGVSGVQLHLKTCPFCGDNRYRTYMNAETGFGNCFKCGETFGLHKFLTEHLQIKGFALSRYLSDVLRLQGWRPKRTMTVDVDYGDVVLPTSFALPTKDGQNLVYLAKRGVDNELAGYFRLRCCLQGWWNFKDEEGNRRGQKFDNRIIIPIFDLDGELRTFQGRDITGTAERKYLFPKGLPGTGRFLFNAQNAGPKVKRIVMGEGAFDVIGLKRALDEDPALRDVLPVGSFGKHLSYGAEDGNDQLGRFLQLKERGLEEVTIIWDGEEKALLSALQAAQKIRGIGINARIGLLPAEEDPGSAKAEDIRKAFYQAQPYSTALAVKWRLKNPYMASEK